ncbi:C4-dicarboxylate ABC transporter [Synergistales bacterium]|nr:C4-dicarboxylate ABC transporter [Synergistales bacterium]
MAKCRNMFAAPVAMLVLLFANAAMAKTEFRLSNQFPPSHHISKGLVLFAEKASEYSGGEVTCKIFDSAQLYKDTEIIEALQDSLVETGLVATNKWSGIISVIDVFDMPFIFKDISSIKKFLDAGVAEILDRKCEDKGVKNLFWVDYGYIQLFNNKRPITSPGDIMGLTMRSFSSSDSETLNILGAHSIVMSSSEMYEALKSGKIDGATTGMPAAVSRGIEKVQRFMTLANYSTAQFVVQGNLEWWGSVPARDRYAIMKAGKDAEAWIRSAIADSEIDAQKVIIAAGVEIHELTPYEHKAFLDATLRVRASFVAKTGELGKKLIDLAFSVE